jgi:hypothetical protein
LIKERAFAEEYVRLTRTSFDPSRKLSPPERPFRLRPGIGVAFAPRHIILFDEQRNRRIAIDGTEDWQQHLIRSLYAGWMKGEDLVRVCAPGSGVQEAHLAHWFSRLEEWRLIEMREDAPASGGLVLLDGLALFEGTDALVSEGRHWKVMPFVPASEVTAAEGPLVDATTVVFCSNDSSAHMRLAEWALSRERTVLHAGLMNNLFYLGPVTSPAAASCFGCLHAHLKKQNFRRFDFELPASKRLDPDAASIARGLIGKWVSWDAEVLYRNWVRCYDFFNCVSQRLYLQPSPECTLCG